MDFGGEAKKAFDAFDLDTRRHASKVLEFLSAGFTITWFGTATNQKVWLALLKPHDNVAEYFNLQKEYVLIGHTFPADFQQRTLLARPPDKIAFRIDTRIRFVASGAPMMRAVCAAWAAEHRMSIFPLDLSQDLPEKDQSAALYKTLSESLWLRDVFDDPEPVTDPAEFFGREKAVQHVVTKVYLGQLVAVFGLRKIGKTSLLRRTRDLLSSDVASLSVTALVQCNATRIRSGRWHVVVGDLIDSWAAALNERAARHEKPFSVRAGKVASLLRPDTPSATDAQVADAFQKDAEKLRRTALSVARTEGLSQIRFVAFFDEVDEVYPQRADAGYWRDDYFALWNALQTLKRGLDDTREVVYILGGVNPSGVESGSLCGRPNPLFEMSVLYLTPLTLDESAELLKGLGSRVGLAFDSDAIDEAFGIAGGHPWLLRKIGSQIHSAHPDRSSQVVVRRANVTQVFERSKRGFHQHVDWILSHLKQVAPDEHRLLSDIATGGQVRYLKEWADEEFRDTFAQHLHNYGLLRFDVEVPSISIGLVAQALKQPVPSDFKDKKREIQSFGDDLERVFRSRIVTDVASERTREEAVHFIATAIPKEAKNRPKTRKELTQLGLLVGLQPMVEALNWDDYVLVLTAPESGVSWAGPDLAPAARRRVISDATKIIHLARHNNDTELRARLDEAGFESVWSALSKVRDMMSP